MIFLLIELSAESVIAICALIVSIISVVFTWHALKYQREHNYKSVKPIGVVVVGNYVNNIFVRFDNNGIGPLIIKTVLVEAGNRKANNLIDAIPGNIAKNILWSNFARELENTSVLPNQSIYFINWKINGEHKEKHSLIQVEQDISDLKKILSTTKISINYTDVYDNKMFVSKNIKLLDSM